MKKIIASLFLALLLFSTFTANAFNYTEFNYEEINFSIPEYCSELLFDDDYYTVGKWQTDDASVEFTLKWEYNYDELYLPEATQEEISSFYHSYFYPDENELKIESAEAIDSFDSDTVLITGVISYGEVKSDYTSYLFFTDEYVYVLEFNVFGEDIHGCVGDVISSLYMEPYYYDDDYYDDDEYYDDYDDDDLEFLGLIPVVLSAVVGIVIKSFSKNGTKGSTKTAQTKTQTQAVKVTVPKEKSFSEKFELNGKSVNSFNERFIVGRKETNFAMEELERERKEREKMFK